VVTANKQLIAHCGPELIGLAQRMKQQIEFGASVAGGVPVISGLHEGLAGDELFKICGILNGTCNYILSQIETNGIPSPPLCGGAEAGLAEADPTEDIDGLDARASSPSSRASHCTRTSDREHRGALDCSHRLR